MTLAAWLLAAGVFVFDIVMPPGYAVPLLYLVVVLAGLWAPRMASALEFAGGATGLILVGVFVGARGGSPAQGVFNRAMAVAACWIAAAVITRERRSREARRRSEMLLQQQAALADLGRMATVVAHEVRNPLAGVRGVLQMIGRRPALPEADRMIVGESIQRIDALTEIVRDLVQFARPHPPAPAPVHAADLLADVQVHAAGHPALARISLLVEAASDVQVLADRAQIKLVLISLVLNGAQAMAGSGRIRLLAKDRGARVQLVVADEGPGIPPDVRARLFEPFFTTKSRGTGLGLVTSRRIVEAHGGTLTIECPPDGGTTALVELPVARA